MEELCMCSNHFQWNQLTKLTKLNFKWLMSNPIRFYFTILDRPFYLLLNCYLAVGDWVKDHQTLLAFPESIPFWSCLLCVLCPSSHGVANLCLGRITSNWRWGLVWVYTKKGENGKLSNRGESQATTLLSLLIDFFVWKIFLTYSVIDP